MPIWYTSIGEEHQTVRNTTGLFDLAHMGVLEASGPGSGRFLDIVTTNQASTLAIGKAQYSFLLDPDGRVIDDILIYRRGAERYMLVVNAANSEKDLAWLNVVNDRSIVIDRELPQREVDATVTIRDLRDPAAGDERRVDLAIQGPRSLDVLLAAIGDDGFAKTVRRLGRFEFAEGQIRGVPALVSRTGYTGERIGFEIYVSPDRAVELWKLLLEVGSPAGLKPIGLGARDSLRTEAGFPLYGHELAGEHEISPIGAGYGGFIKLHKPFFIGRKSLVQGERQRKLVVARYRMDARGGRMARSGDPVVNRRGEYVGRVTSGTAIEGVQFGLAYVDRDSAEVGAPLAVFPLSAAPRGRPEKAKADLGPGDRVLLPESATVRTRFM
jgi:glycine hydroxymethyltransferase